MTQERTGELLILQVNLVGAYNRNAPQVILAEVNAKLRHNTVDQLITERL